MTNRRRWIELSPKELRVRPSTRIVEQKLGDEGHLRARPTIPAYNLRFRGELEGSARGGEGQVENPLDVVLTLRVPGTSSSFTP